MDKKKGYLVLRVLMNLVFLYFIGFGLWVWSDSRQNPDLYSVPAQPSSINRPEIAGAVDIDAILKQNEQLKGMYWHWMNLYTTFVYPMLLVILVLFVGKPARSQKNYKHSEPFGHDQFPSQ